MRMMNLPDLPPTPDLPQENVDLVAERGQAPMPFPRFSLMLVAYMAWPQHQAFRDEWMSTNLARFLESSGTRLSASEGGDRTLVALKAFGWLDALANAADHTVSDRLIKAQHQWPHVADVFQYLVDMAYDDRLI
jgi:hypothetical protein